MRLGELSLVKWKWWEEGEEDGEEVDIDCLGKGVISIQLVLVLLGY